MSHDHDAKPYHQLIINAWTILSGLVAAGIFLMLAFNGPLTRLFHWIWDLLRWISSPII